VLLDRRGVVHPQGRSGGDAALDSSQKGVHSAQGENPADWVQAPETGRMGRGDAAAHAGAAEPSKRLPKLGHGVAGAGNAVAGTHVHGDHGCGGDGRSSPTPSTSGGG
jgi:hypothetical protein